jgi:hypothetical protein
MIIICTYSSQCVWFHPISMMFRDLPSNFIHGKTWKFAQSSVSHFWTTNWPYIAIWKTIVCDISLILVGGSGSGSTCHTWHASTWYTLPLRKVHYVAFGWRGCYLFMLANGQRHFLFDACVTHSTECPHIPYKLDLRATPWSYIVKKKLNTIRVSLDMCFVTV